MTGTNRSGASSTPSGILWGRTISSANSIRLRSGLEWSEVADVWPHIRVMSGSEQFERLLRRAPETKLPLFLTTLPLLQEEGPFGETWTSPGSERRVVLP